tara:strand:+ start:3023 stop:3232 length:210 start_codon:yes stop_codon:yes gene_type:complete
MHYDYTDSYFDDGRDEENEYIQCFCCEDMVLLKDTDEYRFFNPLKSKKQNKILFEDTNICIRCTESMGD